MLSFAVQFIFGMFTAVFALFTLTRLGFNSVNNAIFFGAFGLTLMLMQGVMVGRWVNRFGEYRVLLAGLLLMAVGFGVTAFTPQQAVPWYSEVAMIAELAQQGADPAQLALLPSEAGAGFEAFLIILLGLLPGTMGFTLQLPTINTLITKRAEEAIVGEAVGVSAAFIGAGTVVGPALGGWLFEQIGPSAPFTAVSLLAAALLILVVRVAPAVGKQGVEMSPVSVKQ